MLLLQLAKCTAQRFTDYYTDKIIMWHLPNLRRNFFLSVLTHKRTIFCLKVSCLRKKEPVSLLLLLSPPAVVEITVNVFETRYKLEFVRIACLGNSIILYAPLSLSLNLFPTHERSLSLSFNFSHKLSRYIQQASTSLQ